MGWVGIRFCRRGGKFSRSWILSRARITLALQNAALAAGLELTMEVMIAEAPKDVEYAHGGGAPGGMGGMDM